MHNILLLVGFSIVLLSNIELMFNAFKKSLWWGLGYLCVPFAALVFVIKHWDDTKNSPVSRTASLSSETTESSPSFAATRGNSIRCF